MKKSIFIYLSLVFLVGCQPDSSGDDSSTPSPNKASENLMHVEAKTKQSRNLLFKNDSSISYCEASLEGTQPKIYSGYRDFKLYPSASVSKVFLTAWALSKLGPDYKFIHEWKLVKYQDGSIDAYLTSNFDPVFNIEKVLYSIAQIQRYGIKGLRNLYIAKSTRVYLSVLNNPHIELDTIPVSSQDSVENLKLILNSSNWGAQTETARNNILNYYSKQGKSITLPQSFSVQNVILDENGQALTRFKNSTSVKIQSSSLFKYLKDINVNSNNYMTDALFSLLGGESEFVKFQKQILGLGTDALVVKTGSGLPVNINGERVDNKASCFAILKTMQFVKIIAEKNSLDLGYLLLTAGSDQGTYETDLVINKSVVLKTGRLYDVPTLNLSGIASTQKGLIAFTFLGHDFNNDQEAEMKSKRDQLLGDLLGFYQEKPLFQTLSQNEIFFQ